jgi:lysyl-tRNA synthetase class 2
MSPESKNSTVKGKPALSNKENLRQRARIIRAVRGFFYDRGYLEVETPYILPTPIPEAHIEYVETPTGVLQPSPEIYMKRLVSEGYSKIFQVARCFRGKERGDRHLTEFTLLEWYRTGTDYMELMDECESMIRSVAGEIGLKTPLSFQKRLLKLGEPWERITVREAFNKYAPGAVDQAMKEGRFDEVLVSLVEPALGDPVPTFIYNYPASMASLARIGVHDSNVCERFELYMGGLEIANGFSELVDPLEQRLRFEEEVEARRKAGMKTYPIPEPFLKALEKMPAAAGIALGLDRLAMIFCDAGTINDVVSFTPEDG